MPEPESALFGRPLSNHFRADSLLRMLLLGTALSGLLVALTSNQTAFIPLRSPPYVVSHAAKWTHSPALIYLVASLAAVCLYSAVSLVVSACAAASWSRPVSLLSLLIITDMLSVGVLAAATGTGGAVGYVGLKGNSHVKWNKICDVYDKFCRHIGSAVALSLAACVVLLTLVALSSHSLHRRISR